MDKYFWPSTKKKLWDELLIQALTSMSLKQIGVKVTLLLQMELDINSGAYIWDWSYFTPGKWFDIEPNMQYIYQFLG